MSIVAAYAVPHPPLIVPAVGHGEEKAIQATRDAYHEVARRIVEHQPQTIVVVSPHAPLYRDGFYISLSEASEGNMAQFRAPQEHLEVLNDTEFEWLLAQELKTAGILTAGAGSDVEELDHASYVPLFFLREHLEDFKLVRVGLSGLSSAVHRHVGECIARVARETNRKTVLIASGDLSHKLTPDGPYGFAAAGPEFDARIVELFSSNDLDGLFALDPLMCEAAAECGLRSFEIMAGALEDTAYDAEVLSYEGPFGVGYAVAAFEVKSDAASNDGTDVSEGVDASEEVDPYVALARASVEGYVTTGAAINIPADTPHELRAARAGVFVSLHEHGELRGCIGTISPVRDSIAQEIIANGIAACSEDPRFAPVLPQELDYLEYSVDVLACTEPVASLDQLDPKRYGVIVTKGMKRGLLLPNLEGVDTIDQQLGIAMAKAGISPEEAPISIERFEVVRHTKGGESRVAE